MLEDGIIPAKELKHSGMGVTSFVTSLVIGVLIILCYVIIAVRTVTTGVVIDRHSSFAIVIGLIVLALLMFDLIALGLGIAGILQKDRKKTYAILGIIISSAMILMVISLMIVGLTHQAG